MDNTNSMMERLDEFLLDVQKPSRYIGGETGSVVKDKSKVDIRSRSASRTPTRSECPTWA